MGKSEDTTNFILEKVAPYFNKHGYHGTSMSDLTEITGLTKGAIYGNFDSKEDLALEAFRFNIKILLGKIAKVITPHEKSYDKLLAITNFYKDYMDYSESLGGCPILKVGMDSLNNDDQLREKVTSATKKLKKSLENIIIEGQCNNEIKTDIDAEKFSNVIYGTIEGGVLLASILNDKKPLHDNIDHLNENIKNIILQ